MQWNFLSLFELIICLLLILILWRTQTACVTLSSSRAPWAFKLSLKRAKEILSVAFPHSHVGKGSWGWSQHGWKQHKRGTPYYCRCFGFGCIFPKSWSSCSLFLLWSALSWFLLLVYGKAAANLHSLGMYLVGTACENPGRLSSHVLWATELHLHKGSFYTEKLLRLNKIISQIPAVDGYISVTWMYLYSFSLTE